MKARNETNGNETNGVKKFICDIVECEGAKVIELSDKAFNEITSRTEMKKPTIYMDAFTRNSVPYIGITIFQNDSQVKGARKVASIQSGRIYAMNEKSKKIRVPDSVSGRLSFNQYNKATIVFDTINHFFEIWPGYKYVPKSEIEIPVGRGLDVKTEIYANFTGRF